MIEGYKKSFKDQPTWKIYQNEAYRISKMDYAKRINEYKKSWYKEFAMGALLSLPFVIYIGYRKKWSFSSVPFYYRSAYYQKAQMHNRTTNLKWNQVKYGGGFGLLFAYTYAYMNCKNYLLEDELVITDKKAKLPY